MLIVVSEYRFLHTEELPISVENYHNEYLKCLYLDISGRQNIIIKNVKKMRNLGVGSLNLNLSAIRSQW